MNAELYYDSHEGQFNVVTPDTKITEIVNGILNREHIPPVGTDKSGKLLYSYKPRYDRVVTAIMIVNRIKKLQ